MNARFLPSLRLLFAAGSCLTSVIGQVTPAEIQQALDDDELPETAWSLGDAPALEARVETDGAPDGEDALRLTTFASGDSSEVQDLLVVTLEGPGALVFHRRSETQNRVDRLLFELENEAGDLLPGVLPPLSYQSPWQAYVVPIPSGRVRAVWRHEHNGGVSGAETLLDRVRFFAAGDPVIVADPVTHDRFAAMDGSNAIEVEEGDTIPRRTGRNFFGDRFELPVEAQLAPGSTGTLSYLWFHDDVALSGQTEPTLVIPSLAPADAGRYAVEVTHDGRTVRSREAVLTVEDHRDFSTAVEWPEGTWRSAPSWTVATSPNATAGTWLVSPPGESELALGHLNTGRLEFDLSTEGLGVDEHVELLVNGRWVRSWRPAQLWRDQSIVVPADDSLLVWRVRHDSDGGGVGIVALDAVRRADHPRFAEEERDLTVLAGQRVRLHRPAYGAPGVTYRWYRGTGGGRSMIPGATSASLDVEVEDESVTITVEALVAGSAVDQSLVQLEPVVDVPVTLAPGDVAVTRVQRGRISLLALRDLAAGTQVVLSDRTWSTAARQWSPPGSPGAAGEGFLVATIPAAGLPAGASLALELHGVLELDFDEELYLFQGAADSPHFLLALRFPRDWSRWANVPEGLEVGLTAGAIGAATLADAELDAVYDSAFAGSVQWDQRDLLWALYGRNGTGWTTSLGQQRPLDHQSLVVLPSPPRAQWLALERVAAEPSAGESSSVTLAVARAVGDTAQALSVRVRTLAGGFDAEGQTGNAASAAPGVDYQPVDQTLSWPAGDATPRLVLIPLLHNPTSTGRTSFWVILEPSGNDPLPTVAHVHLIDSGLGVTERREVFPTPLGFESVDYEAVFANEDDQNAEPSAYRLEFTLHNRSSRPSQAGMVRLVALGSDPRRPDVAPFVVEVPAIAAGGTYTVEELVPDEGRAQAGNPFFEYALLEAWEHHPDYPGEPALVQRIRLHGPYAAPAGNPPSGGQPMTPRQYDDGAALGRRISSLEVAPSPIRLVNAPAGVPVEVMGVYSPDGAREPVAVTWSIRPEGLFTVSGGRVMALQSGPAKADLTATYRAPTDPAVPASTAEVVTRTVTVEATAPAATGQLRGQAGDASLTVSWDSVPGAVQYRGDVATDAAFTMFAAQGRNVNLGTNRSWTVGNLPPGAYHVRIRVLDDDDRELAVLQTGLSIGGRFINISSRGWTEPGEPLIAGFAIAEAEKRVLLRGVGPGLRPFGVTRAVADPELKLYRGAGVIGEADNWDAGDETLVTTMSRIGAFALAPDSRDAAFLITLPAGVYTVHLGAASGEAGIGLLEVWEVDRVGRFTNLSSRSWAGPGEEALFVAAIVEHGQRALLRVVGPGLQDKGVADFLPDPLMRVYRTSTLLWENDDWSAGADPQSVVSAGAGQAFDLVPGSADAALVVLLPDGPNSVVGAGKDGSAGTVLVELYIAP